MTSSVVVVKGEFDKAAEEYRNDYFMSDHAGNVLPRPDAVCQPKSPEQTRSGQIVSPVLNAIAAAVCAAKDWSECVREGDTGLFGNGSQIVSPQTSDAVDADRRASVTKPDKWSQHAIDTQHIILHIIQNYPHKHGVVDFAKRASFLYEQILCCTDHVFSLLDMDTAVKNMKARTFTDTLSPSVPIVIPANVIEIAKEADDEGATKKAKPKKSRARKPKDIVESLSTTSPVCTPSVKEKKPRAPAKPKAAKKDKKQQVPTEKAKKVVKKRHRRQRRRKTKSSQLQKTASSVLMMKSTTEALHPCHKNHPKTQGQGIAFCSTAAKTT